MDSELNVKLMIVLVSNALCSIKQQRWYINFEGSKMKVLKHCEIFNCTCIKSKFNHEVMGPEEMTDS